MIAHVRLLKINRRTGESESASVEYDVESIDFNSHRNWESIGKLIINKEKMDYVFLPMNALAHKRVLPPSFFYKMNDVDLDKLNAEYEGYAYGAWASSVHAYAIALLNRVDSPSCYPPLFFSEETKG